MRCTAIAQIVTVHAGDHHIAQLQSGNGLGQAGGLVGVEWVGAAMAHITKRAAPGALVAHDHEGRGSFAETLADVGARGLLAHGDQLVFAQDFFDVVEAAAGAGGLDADPIGFFEDFGSLDFDRNTSQLGCGLLLDAGVVQCGGHGHGMLQGDRP